MAEEAVEASQWNIKMIFNTNQMMTTMKKVKSKVSFRQRSILSTIKLSNIKRN